MIRRTLSNTVLSVLSAVLILGTASAASAQTKATANLAETAVAAGNFKTLVTALKAADLADTIATKGPFTVFAPTDEAFAKIPKPILTALLEDKKTLSQILLYHVVDGKVPASTVTTLTSAKTLNGDVKVAVKDGTVTVNNATVTSTDIEASNGIIHVIDTVLIPEGLALPAGNVVDAAVAAGSFKTLATALTAAGLVDTLKNGEGPFTVFAPNDAAFAKLPAGTLEGLLADKEKLKAVLLYHVVSGRVNSTAVTKLDKAKTLGGPEVAIKVVDGKVKINDSTVTTADIQTGNGVIHVIDTVLMPPAAPAKKSY